LSDEISFIINVILSLILPAITGWFTRAGSYVFTAPINSNTYNINTQGVSAITVIAQNMVEAKTIRMPETGRTFTYPPGNISGDWRTTVAIKEITLLTHFPFF
jgi:hypothetical protein